MMYTLTKLQKTYPEFIYESCVYAHKKESLFLTFTYSCGEHRLQTNWEIPGVSEQCWQECDQQKLKHSAFELGLVESLSYWKAFCSPKITVNAGVLSDTAIPFWQKLIYNGMGEYFYVNKIHPFSPEIQSLKLEPIAQTIQETKKETASAILVPVGGGKDSIVTLELLASGHFQLFAYTISSLKAQNETIRVFSNRHKLKGHIQVVRRLDPKLKKLNELGYFNGHTPFSAVVAFSSILIAQLFDIPQIALSNEASASEETLSFDGITVNHQYSKSLEFENDFRSYITQHYPGSANYFSFLRPFYEIQIAQLFSAMTPYHHVFLSCNVGSKTGTWCGNCPKCLFVYLLLGAFLDPETLQSIFGSEVLDNESLSYTFEQLTGIIPAKAFECVGTRRETRLSACILAARYKEQGLELPKILSRYVPNLCLDKESLREESQALLGSYDHTNNVPKELERIVTHAC